MREGEAVVVPPDLADEGALRRVLEEARLVGAVVDVDVALRVGGDPHVLAGVDPGGFLKKLGTASCGMTGHVGRRRARLRRERLKEQGRRTQQRRADRPRHKTLH